MLVSVVCSPNMIHSTYPTLALMLGKGMPLFEEGSSESAAALRGHPSSLVETPYLFEETLRNEFGALSPGRGGGGMGLEGMTPHRRLPLPPLKLAAHPRPASLLEPWPAQACVMI